MGCGPQTRDRGLRPADFSLRTADYGLRTAHCGLRAADGRLGIKHGLRYKMRLTNCSPCFLLTGLN